jgi:hypothetical protein
MELMVPLTSTLRALSHVETPTGLLEAVSFLDADGLKRVLTVGSLDMAFSLTDPRSVR